MALEISRRLFIKLFAGAIAVGATVPAMNLARSPYVAEGESVSFIGGRGGFTGGQTVRRILPWDGVGYPVETCYGGYGKHVVIEVYYDFDLANFNREVPEKFWWSEENRKRYPNVHTYLREKRFGESIAQAIANLNFVGIDPADWVFA